MLTPRTPPSRGPQSAEKAKKGVRISPDAFCITFSQYDGQRQMLAAPTRNISSSRQTTNSTVSVKISA